MSQAGAPSAGSTRYLVKIIWRWPKKVRLRDVAKRNCLSAGDAIATGRGCLGVHHRRCMEFRYASDMITPGNDSESEVRTDGLHSGGLGGGMG
jgi:hypothetical protein